MFVVNDDMSIYVTRGDVAFFTVTADNNGVNYKFQPGDIVRIKVTEKKACENVMFQKDFLVEVETEKVEILLTEEETKIGEVISKPTDYWYEIELNPYTNPQTIVGYDDDGAKIFKLFPEGRDLGPEVEPEEVAVVDEELSLTSDRPVQNQAVTRALTELKGDIQKIEKSVSDSIANIEGAANKSLAATDNLSTRIDIEHTRINNLVANTGEQTEGNAELIDIRVGADGAVYGSAGEAVRGQFGDLSKTLDNNTNSIIALNKELHGKSNITDGLKCDYGYYTSNGKIHDTWKREVTSPLLPGGKYDFILPNGIDIHLIKYDGSNYEVVYNWSSGSRLNQYISTDFYVAFRNTDLSDITDMRLFLSNIDIIQYVETENPVFVKGIEDGCIKELFLLDEGIKIKKIQCAETSYRITFTDTDGSDHYLGLDNVSTEYSGKIIRLVNLTTAETRGYIVLSYLGTESYFNNNNGFEVDYTFAGDLNYSPLIIEYLNRYENLVLIGDSLFGYHYENLLEEFLRERTEKLVYNCGFGGCRMSYTDDENYQYLSFAGVADAIDSGSFTNMESAISLNKAYPYRLSALKDIDWTKPTTIFVNYCNNDITASIPVGDLWEYTAESFDNTTLLGAMNYGIKKILSKYPHVRIVFFTEGWRYKVDSEGKSVPPYAYENSIGLTSEEYNNAIVENAKRQGVSFYDFLSFGGRNNYNISEILYDGSHFNIKGYKEFAVTLDALDKSVIR